jgi:hypothetical protein
MTHPIILAALAEARYADLRRGTSLQRTIARYSAPRVARRSRRDRIAAWLGGQLRRPAGRAGRPVAAASRPTALAGR